MGAWSHEVLTNDSALDLMWDLEESNDIHSDVQLLLNSRNNTAQLLLAIEIVDISINGVDETILGGFYNYELWFNALTQNPMHDLLSAAVSALEFVKNNDNGWFPEYVNDRCQLLEQIRQRLLQVNEVEKS